MTNNSVPFCNLVGFLLIFHMGWGNKTKEKTVPSEKGNGRHK